MTSGNNEQIATKLNQHVKEHLRASQQKKSVEELDAMIGLLLLNKSDVVELPVTTEATETVQAPMTTVATTSRETQMTTVATTSREAQATTEAAETICTSTSTRTVQPTTLQATPTKGAASPMQTLMKALVVTESLEKTKVRTTEVAPDTIDGPAPETTQSPTIARLPTATIAPTVIQSPIGANTEAPTTSGTSTSMQTPTTFVPTARSTPTTVQSPETTHSIINASKIQHTVSAPIQAPIPKRYTVAIQTATTQQQQQVVKCYPTTIRYAAAPPTTMQQPPATRHYPTTIRYAAAGSRPPTAQQAPAEAAAVAPTQRRSLQHLFEAVINRLKQRRRRVPAHPSIQSAWAALAELQASFGHGQLDDESMDHRAVGMNRLCDEYMHVMALLNDFIYTAFEE